jgi:SAM-dependent methyltransferase
MSEETNAAQIDYWNEVSGPKWVAMQEQLDEQLGPLQAVLIDTVNAGPNESVLDIGCGCGASSLALGEAVGAGGRVDGVDISAPMLERARARAAEAGLDHVTFHRGDAQVYDFEGEAYDHVTSRFGIMFFDDPVVAFRNLRGALKPDGALTFICWRPMMENPWMTIPAMAAAQHIELPVPPEPNAPGPFGLADAERTERLLKEAGFTDVSVEAHDAMLHVGPGGTLEASVEFTTQIGPVSSILKDVDSETIEKVKASIHEALKAYETDDGVKLNFATWVVQAR